MTVPWVYLGLMLLFGGIVGRATYEIGHKRGREKVHAAWRRAVHDYRIIDRAEHYRDTLH